MNKLEEKFWSGIRLGGPQDCWEWSGRTNHKGYGYIWHERNIRVHRYAWQLKNGPIPDGFLILHKCDNRICANPDHLFAGTQQDNMDDMARKGRSCRGEKNRGAILTPAQVLEIHKSKIKSSALAKMYGMSHRQINAIKAADCWKHILIP